MPPRSAKTQKPHADYVCMSTVEDLSYTPSAEEKNRDAAQIVATGRRSWKTLRGRGEAVWPPHLEAALIEALEKYKPDESRSSKTSGRFSMRNRFISDYIYESTGKQRTPKQVGSRLQQLRDTCKSEKILQLISRRSIEDDADPEQQGTAYRQSPSVSPSVERSLSQSTVSQSPVTIWVHLALERSPWSDSSVPPLISLANNEKAMTQVIHLISKSSGMNFSSSRHGFVNTGLLSHLEPMVAFESPYVLETRCSFSVFMDGSGIPIHSEFAYLTKHSHTQSSGMMYSGRLVPGFWQSLCESSAPTRFTIMQNVCLTPRASIGPADLSIIYNFTQPIPDNTEVLLHTMPEYTGNSATDFTFTTRSSLTSASMRHWNDMIANDDSNSYHYSPVMFNSDLVPQYDISSAPRYDRATPQTSWGYGQRYTPTTHHIASGTPY
ncbi:TEA/ATTS domain family-domain-containing protein [Lentinula raphanica]|nr:TEA/ATTS domain family-domain-containing protein [Lentinula raphanica]KAJ3830067.1 TEA/ATTS domain family-domain-containing protein [Lentinula raphanica]KAJ3974504.1 TEA/ATTS domain family-domain-containing protein [Lentinula raphanica]